MTDKTIEKIIATRDLPQGVIDYMRANLKFPTPPETTVRVFNFTFPVSTDEFTPDYIEEQLGIRPSYIGGIVMDVTTFQPHVQVVFEKFTMEFGMEPAGDTE